MFFFSSKLIGIVLCVIAAMPAFAKTLTSAPGGPLLFNIENSLLNDFQVQYRISTVWLTKNNQQPVEVRIRYPVRNEWHKLTYLQKRFAYGVRDVRQEKKFAFSFALSSLKDKRIFVRRQNGKWLAFVHLRGQLHRLSKIFVYATGKSYWPNVHYIRLYVRNEKQKRWYYEKIEHK